MSEYSACIIVPNYNHWQNFELLVSKLLTTGLPIIVVNDGSGQETREVLEHITANHAEVDVVHLEQNGGKGAAVMAGLGRAKARGFSHGLQIDADGQHDTADIGKFLTASKAAPEVLFSGKPAYDKSMPKGRYYGRYITHIWVWIETLSFSIADSMCGFRIYPLAPTVDLIDSVRLGKRMDFDTEVMVRLYWRGTDVRFLSTRVIYPEDGVSHFRLWGDNWMISKMHTRLFFGMLLRLPILLWRKLKK